MHIGKMTALFCANAPIICVYIVCIGRFVGKGIEVVFRFYDGMLLYYIVAKVILHESLLSGLHK